MRKAFLWIVPLLLLLAGCSTVNTVIVNEVEEREANEIVVFLASRNISAVKIAMKATGAVGATGPSMYSIAVESKDMTEAMSILNQNGLPRKKGTNLLELFSFSGIFLPHL